VSVSPTPARTPHLIISEKQFQAQVVELARLGGWLLYHTHDFRRSAPGFPDLVMVRPPRLVFAELKTEKGRIRPEQRVRLEGLSGCTQASENPPVEASDLEEAQRILQRGESR
jgi:VRR-NUC domain